jgi:hypothetical protein
MVETEIKQTSLPEHESASTYAVGDVVKLRNSVNPDALWLLTTPIKETPDGLMTGGIEVTQDGKGLGVDGSILVNDIIEKVGPRKTRQELTEIYIDAFETKYGNTIPRAEVAAMLARQIGEEPSER